MNRHSKIDPEDVLHPVVHETFLTNLILDGAEQTTHKFKSKLRMTSFMDSWTDLVTSFTPNNSKERTFLSLSGKEEHYKTTSSSGPRMTYDFYLDRDANIVERHTDSFITLIQQVGGIYKGLSIIGHILLFYWQTYIHN